MADNYDSEEDRGDASQSQSQGGEGEDGEEEDKEPANFLEGLQHKTKQQYKKPKKKDGKTDTTQEDQSLDAIGFEDG